MPKRNSIELIQCSDCGTCCLSSKAGPWCPACCDLREWNGGRRYELPRPEMVADKVVPHTYTIEEYA